MDPNFQRIQEISQLSSSTFLKGIDLLIRFRHLSSIIYTFVDHWASAVQTLSTYNLYEKVNPANEATNQFVNNLH